MDQLNNIDEFDTFESQYGKMGKYSPKEDRGYTDDYPPLELNNSELVTVFEFPDQLNRLDELDLASYADGNDMSVPLAYQSYHDVNAVVAITGDPHRVALHVLGNQDRPAGVSSGYWQNLGFDKITFPKPSFKLHTEPVYEIPSDAGYAVVEAITPAPPETVDSGDINEAQTQYEMPFLDHLEEFRWAILKSIIAIGVCMILGWFLSEEFWSTITHLANQAELPLMFNELLEPIMTRLQMALVIGLVIAAPFVFYFIWSFIAPGLYNNEKRWILPMVWSATACFFAGVSLAYFIIIPFMLQFMRAFIPEDITAMIKVSNFISTLLKFTILFGLIFEMPMVTFVLAKVGVVKYTFMKQYRKYAIIVIFVLGAVLTPPDPISQIIMAAPLIILYEISIWVARFAGRKTLI